MPLALCWSTNRERSPGPAVTDHTSDIGDRTRGTDHSTRLSPVCRLLFSALLQPAWICCVISRISAGVGSGLRDLTVPSSPVGISHVDSCSMFLATRFCRFCRFSACFSRVANLAIRGFSAAFQVLFCDSFSRWLATRFCQFSTGFFRVAKLAIR